jgi:type IV pilus assembly protein PilO
MKLGMRELIFLTVMLGLLGSSWFLIFKKNNIRRDQLRADTEYKQKALNNLKQSTQQIGNLNRKIEDLHKAIEFFESKLPQEKEIAEILDQLSKLAEANSLHARTFKTLKTERNANYSEQPIQLSISGDFYGFYSFLLQLETLPRITRINQMKLEKISERDGEMQAEVTLSIFFVPDSARTVASAR